MKQKEFVMPVYRAPDFTEERFANAPDAAFAVCDMDGVAPDGYPVPKRRSVSNGKSLKAFALSGFSFFAAIRKEGRHAEAGKRLRSRRLVPASSTK